jgi:hypothetical protein
MTVHSSAAGAFLHRAFVHMGVDAALPPLQLFDFALFGSDSSRSSSNSDDSSLSTSSSSSTGSSSSGSSTVPSIERRDENSSVSSSDYSSLSSTDIIDRLIEQHLDPMVQCTDQNPGMPTIITNQWGSSLNHVQSTNVLMI